ncbi:MAG: hypothetical protein Q7V62_14935, partial [Actinomycetota bacterium]|nr:hypothetical protein [Actinomycetota bacterium]
MFVNATPAPRLDESVTRYLTVSVCVVPMEIVGSKPMRIVGVATHELTLAVEMLEPVSARLVIVTSADAAGS